MSDTATHTLATYLKDRRTRLDPASFGLAGGRRRTPGLRREEVAQRANISATWYTWLEQGRGGAPSADVLDRIAKALILTDIEREHLYMLGLGRPPEVHYKPVDGVTPRLQRILDAFTVSPALIKTPMWDVIAWNRAAATILTDYGKLPPSERNVLRLVFSSDRVRAAQRDWKGVARFLVSSFRADVVRAGASAEVTQFVEDMSRTSAEFAALWQENDVATAGGGVKQLHHDELGPLDLEFSIFAVDGRPELSMVVYNPTSSDHAEKIRGLIEKTERASR